MIIGYLAESKLERIWLSGQGISNVAMIQQTGEGWIYLLAAVRTGTRSCIQRLVVRGRRRELGLGSIPFVSFAEARETAVANRKVAREGVELADKHHVRAMPTVAEAAESVLEQKRPGWRSSKHGQQWWSTVMRFTLPHLGRLPVCEVTSADVLHPNT